jgi:hypothetical protein
MVVLVYVRLILKILLFGAKESRTETMKVSKKSFDF